MSHCQILIKSFNSIFRLKKKQESYFLSEAASYPFSIANEKKEPSATSEDIAETTASSEVYDTSEDSSVISDEYHPFDQPQLFNGQVSSDGLTTIEPEYVTDGQGTYPKAMWQPNNNQYVRNHQGNRQGKTTMGWSD